MRIFFFFSVLILGLASCNCIPCMLAKESFNFNKEQIGLIMFEEHTDPMKLWLVTDKKEFKLLRRQSEDVIFSAEDKALSKFINRLYATVTDSINAGVGIAAPQVGITKNIIWVQRFDKLDYPFEVYINPTITYYSNDKQPCQEGCLSIPGRSDMMEVRSQEIEINYINAKGVEITERVSGFTAVIFQHEIDHLNGIIYTDYLDTTD